MGKKWVTASFKDILVEYCQDYLNSNDLGKNKDRTQLIGSVADKIREAAQTSGDPLPNDLSKSIATWFGNEAKSTVGQPAETSAKRKGRKNKPGKQWTKRWVAAEIYSDRLTVIHKEQTNQYSGDGQATLRTYASALTSLMGELSPQELEECQELADVWNTQPVPRDIQQKATKRFPALARKFMATAQREMGITVFMLVKYRNAEGQGSVSKFETDGSTFVTDKPAWRKGPGNILDMWRDWSNDYADDDDEEEGGEEDDLALSYREEDGYPLLPAINSNIPLDRLKRLLRIYAREVRKFQKCPGRIPWGAIRADNDAHIPKKSRYKDITLEDPSRMSQKAILGFLGVWYKRQEDGKQYPLMFHKPEYGSSDDEADDEAESRRKRKGKRVERESRDIDTGVGEDEVHGEDTESQRRRKPKGRVLERQGGDADGGDAVEGEGAGVGGSGGDRAGEGGDRAGEKGDNPPLAIIPLEANKSKSTRLSFLRTLTKDPVYHSLFGLLEKAKPSSKVDSVGRPAPAWADWSYDGEYLPPAFHRKIGTGSLTHVLAWLRGNPLAAFEGKKACYGRIERTILAVGLAMREIETVVFTEPDDARHLPGYVQRSPHEVENRNQLIDACRKLVAAASVNNVEPAGGTNANADPKSKRAGGDSGPQNPGKEKKSGRAGLTGIPAALSGLREDLGLMHPEWDQLGAQWQEFARKWLSAENTLGKAARGNMGVDELQSTDLPIALKEWGAAQITNTPFDDGILTDDFGGELKGWWDGLGLKAAKAGDDLLKLPWCRAGKSGILMLVVGMRLWAEKSGGGKDWTRVLKEMAAMWELIAATPSLARAKRTRGEAEAGPSSKKKARK